MESHGPSSSVSGLFTQRKDVQTLQLFAALYHRAAPRRTAVSHPRLHAWQGWPVLDELLVTNVHVQVCVAVYLHLR